MASTTITVNVRKRRGRPPHAGPPPWLRRLFRWLRSVVGGLLLALALVACTGEPTPTATLIPTPPSTPTPTATPVIPTATPTPTATATATVPLPFATPATPASDEVVLRVTVPESPIQVLGNAEIMVPLPEAGASAPFRIRIWNRSVEPVTFRFESIYDTRTGLVVVLDDGEYERTLEPGYPVTLTGRIYSASTTRGGTYDVRVVFPKVRTPGPELTPTPTLAPDELNLPTQEAY